MLPPCLSTATTHPDNELGGQFRKDHGTLDSTRMYAYVGALLPRKGLDILLNAWCRASVPADNVVLVVKTSYSHGGEALRQKLLGAESHEACGKLIHLDGWLGEGGLESLYDAADILVHPSRAEGFGLTPMRQWAVGNS